MNVTAAAVIRLANQDPATRWETIKQSGKHNELIEKAKKLMHTSEFETTPDDPELVNKLDVLIGECSFPAMKEKFGDAVEIF